jgi:hypothetical protein
VDVTANNLDLMAALARAAVDFERVKRDRANPHLRSQYATLTSAIEATRPALAREGVVVLQAVELVGDGWAVRTRILGHGSELDAGLCPVVVGDAKGLSGAQAWGSALTYARRYGYSAALCLAPSDDDDDDGHAAGPAPKRAPAPKAKPAEKPDATPAEKPPRPPPRATAEVAALLSENGLGLADLAAWRESQGKAMPGEAKEWGRAEPPSEAWYWGSIFARLVAGEGRDLAAWVAAQEGAP